MLNTDYKKPIVWADSTSDDCNDERDRSNWSSRMLISWMKHEFGAPLKRLQSQEQSTVGWLTPICDLTQWGFCFIFFLSSLFFKRKRNQNVEWCTMTAGSGLKNLQRSNTKCWGQGRQCESASNIRDDEDLRMRVGKIHAHTHTHTQRDRHKETIYFLRHQLQMTTNLYKRLQGHFI